MGKQQGKLLDAEGYFSFEQLEVYQKSITLIARVYQLTGNFPADERFGLTSQIRRAANSITLNIAEGKGCSSDRDFVRFLYQARGSLLETVAARHIAKTLAFSDDLGPLLESCENSTAGSTH
ncbi:MAG: four helix bundle protein [Thermaceae bacterium]|nr:four helix bundle protein [Thermaceae bacterium]